MRIGWVEILLIVVILLLLFGARRIPEVMRGLGKGAREFKEGLKGDDSKEKNEDKPK